MNIISIDDAGNETVVNPEKSTTKLTFSETYLKDSQSCPFCGGDIEVGDLDFNNIIVINAYCHDCKASFDEIYTMTSVELVDYPEDESLIPEGW